MVSDAALLLSHGQLASAASTKNSSSLSKNPCPSGSFAWHGIRRKPKHKPELTRVAPGRIVDERFFIEELVVPDSTELSPLLWLGFSSNSELRGTLRHPARGRVFRLPGRCDWPLLLRDAVQLTDNLRIQFSAWR